VADLDPEPTDTAEVGAGCDVAADQAGSWTEWMADWEVRRQYLDLWRGDGELGSAFESFTQELIAAGQEGWEASGESVWPSIHPGPSSRGALTCGCCL
jgi:hypothetical protein